MNKPLYVGLSCSCYYRHSNNGLLRSDVFIHQIFSRLYYHVMVVHYQWPCHWDNSVNTGSSYLPPLVHGNCILTFASHSVFFFFFPFLAITLPCNVIAFFFLFQTLSTSFLQASYWLSLFIIIILSLLLFLPSPPTTSPCSLTAQCVSSVRIIRCQAEASHCMAGWQADLVLHFLGSPLQPG